jgi:hypothetical protein
MGEDARAPIRIGVNGSGRPPGGTSTVAAITIRATLKGRRYRVNAQPCRHWVGGKRYGGTTGVAGGVAEHKLVVVSNLAVLVYQQGAEIDFKAGLVLQPNFPRARGADTF